MVVTKQRYTPKYPRLPRSLNVQSLRLWNSQDLETILLNTFVQMIETEPYGTVKLFGWLIIHDNTDMNIRDRETI